MQSQDDTVGGIDTIITNAYNSKQQYNSILDQEASAQTAAGDGTYADIQTSHLVSVQQNNLSQEVGGDKINSISPLATLETHIPNVSDLQKRQILEQRQHALSMATQGHNN